MGRRRSFKRVLENPSLSALKGRRTFRAFLIEPFKQIKFGLYVAAVCLFYVVLIACVFVYAFYKQYEQLAEIFGVAERLEILNNKVFWINGAIMGVILLAFVATLLWVVVRRTHRMYGPMVNIIGFVEKLRAGDFSARVRLRKGDDFHDVAAKLNELAETLEKADKEDDDQSTDEAV